MYNVISRTTFSKKRISTVKVADAKNFLISLYKKGASYPRLKTIQSLLKSAFKMAYEDDLIIKNPFSFTLSTIIPNDSTPRKAFTPEEEQNLLKFMKTDKIVKKYYNPVYTLFNTGLRIAELSGLTVEDIHFDERYIDVNKQLCCNGKNLYISKTKTEAGNRKIPIDDELAKVLKNQIDERVKPRDGFKVDGLTNFLFTTTGSGHPVNTKVWSARFNTITKEYNKNHEISLPKFTPHICRHTYCSRMSTLGVNPKVLQYLMGHSKVDVTLNVYTHITYEDAISELSRVNDK